MREDVKSSPRADRDSPWKDILRQYFQEAIAFFFAQTASQIDWSIPYEFLDKEFQQIAPDAEIGKRYADLLVKVWLQQGQELWLLVHLEIQAQPESDFEERMLTYHLRIFDRFHSHATSLAILCDSNARWRPYQYQFTSPDTELTFRFGMVKLLDYRDRWAELEQSSNLFAVVVMTHLKTQETKRNLSSRKIWKLSLIRQLYEKGYARQEIINLFRFIDWVMILPEELSHAFWQELKAYEEEKRMPYLSSIEQIGYEEGKKKGLEQGIEQGIEQGLEQGIEQGLEQGIEQGARQEARMLILRLLTRRLNNLPDSMRSQIEGLALSQLESLGEALLDFSNLSDLEAWLTEQNIS